MEGADNGVAALGARAAELASALPTVVAARLPFDRIAALTGMEPLSVPQQERLAAGVGAGMCVAAIYCACRSGGGAEVGEAEAEAGGGGGGSPSKTRRRPAPVDIAPQTPPPSAEAAAEVLGRRQQVLDEILEVEEACARKLRALDKHFVAPLHRLLHEAERSGIFGETTPHMISDCLELHESLLQKLRAAVDELGVEGAPSRRLGPLTPERGAAGPAAAAALHKLWRASLTDFLGWQLAVPSEAEATLALATVPPPSRNRAVLEHAEEIQQALRRAARQATLPFAGEYTSGCGKVWCSRGTAGAQTGQTISIWRPQLPEGYVYFGDFAHPGEKRPPTSAVGMLIAPEASGNQGMFARPARFERVWGLPKGVNKNILWLWRPIPPSDDFVALGFVGSGDPDDPPKVAVASLRCVHRSLCTQGSTVPELTVTSTAEPAGPIWRYRGKTSRGSPSPKRRIPGQHSLF